MRLSEELPIEDAVVQRGIMLTGYIHHLLRLQPRRQRLKELHPLGVLAGHFGLDNLILIYDNNAVTLDAMANKSQSEDTAKRFEAYGYEVLHIEHGNDIADVHRVLTQAKERSSGKPRFVVARTLIGKGIPEVSGTQKAHGEGGAQDRDRRRRRPLGRP